MAHSNFISIEQHGHHVTCVLIGTSRKLAAYCILADFEQGFEYELVDTNPACPGIHKLRVGPATRSAVAT